MPFPEHEDDMTPYEYRQFKRDFRNGRHSHRCPYDEHVWECHQITHCRREPTAVCPDHADGRQPCPACNGRGELEDSGDPSTGYGPVIEGCEKCDGKGRL
jgi:hypothetical protein